MALALSEIVDTSERVAATRSRKQKTSALAECVARLAPDELRVGVAFLSGELPQGRIGIGHAAVGGVRPEPAAAPSLALLEVDARFERLRAIAGKGSKAAKLAALEELLALASHDEQRFLRGLLLGELRQGALEGLMADAIARAFELPAAEVRRAVMLSGDLAEVASVARAEGREGLARFRLALFRPLQPMLAQPSEGLDDALARLQQPPAAPEASEPAVALEVKLDGARIQLHRDRDEVRVYTRRLHDVTAAVPEIVETALALPAERLLLDGEAIALRTDGRPQPFQTTMRRFGRRRDVEALRRELPITCFFFDCLHLDGEDLIDRPTSERVARLERVVPEPLRVPRLVTASVDEADAFLGAALARGHEGVMAKALGAPYEAGRRGASWFKVKPSHSFDLVVLAVDWGSGRRRGTLSNLHLGARDPEAGGFVMLGKTFKGMTDETLAWQTETFQRLAVPAEAGDDAWTVRVRPEVVAEIACDGVQASPQYPGGVALRFARLKGYRQDKRPDEADTIQSVRALLA